MNYYYARRTIGTIALLVLSTVAFLMLVMFYQPQTSYAATSNAAGGSTEETNTEEGVSGTESLFMGVNMLRLYNPNSGEHFYTKEYPEREILENEGWIYEGFGWSAPRVVTMLEYSGSDHLPDASWLTPWESTDPPVYRLYNPIVGDHHYTMDASERDNLVSLGWIYESVCWYSGNGWPVPVYRQYNPNTTVGTHNYTTDVSERDFLISLGWIDEGIAWYGNWPEEA